MAEIRIVQCLCGPKRHAIMARLYEKGVDEGDQAALLKTAIELLTAERLIDPWCAMCHATSDGWIYEDSKTLFRTMEEAERAGKWIEAANLRAQRAVTNN